MAGRNKIGAVADMAGGEKTSPARDLHRKKEEAMANPHEGFRGQKQNEDGRQLEAAGGGFLQRQR